MLMSQKRIGLHLILSGFIFWWTSCACAETVEYEGLIEPHVIVKVGAPTEGIVARVLVDRSSRIELGQTLVELESSVEQMAVDRAKAMVAFNGEIKLRQAQLDFAGRAHERIKSLEAVSAQDKDQAATDILLSRYNLKKAKENHILAQFELKKALAVLALRSVKSPITGVVVDRYVFPGEYVNTQPLLLVAQTDPLRVEVIVPAQMFGRIIPGMKAIILPELTAYEEQTGTVSIVDKVIDAASNTFGVRLSLPNPDQTLPGGLKCRVRFDITPEKSQEKNPPKDPQKIQPVMSSPAGPEEN